MRIDDEGRKFFSSLETLEQLDDLDRTIDAFIEDLTDRVLNSLRKVISELVPRYPKWQFRSQLRVKGECHVGLSCNADQNSFAVPLRVEFGFNRTAEWGCFVKTWVGIWSNGTKRRYAEIFRRTSSCFRNPERDEGNGYPIFEYLNKWPNLYDDNYAALYYITADNAEAAVQGIALQIEEIVNTIDTATAQGRRTGTRRRSAA